MSNQPPNHTMKIQIHPIQHRTFVSSAAAAAVAAAALPVAAMRSWLNVAKTSSARGSIAANWMGIEARRRCCFDQSIDQSGSRRCTSAHPCVCSAGWW